MKKPAANRAPNLRRAYFETRFGQLHCRTAFPSTGGFDELTPLVVLHDVPGTSADLAALLPQLGNDRSVYLPDLPGCGQSDGPSAAVTVGEYGASVGEMLRGLRLREVDLLGVGVGADEQPGVREGPPRRVVQAADDGLSVCVCMYIYIYI